MTTAQLVSIIIAIICGDGIWRLVEHRLARRDNLKDRKEHSVQDLEDNLSMCSKACLRLLAFNLYSWQETVMERGDKTVGINEMKVMDGQYQSYHDDLNGNGTVTSRQEWIRKNCTQVPDSDVYVAPVSEQRDMM